jgi:RNA recognition motif-containing protein
VLKAIGLYKGPKPPVRHERKPEEIKPQGNARPAKSNVRNARTQDGTPTEKPEGSPAPRGNRGGERARGGDRSTVESPRVYVGNLSYDVSEQDLQELFKGIGGVRNVEIVYNRSTHRSKGYGFVEMLHMDEAIRAVEVLHDQPFMGRKLTVSGAKSKGQDDREDRDERDERPERNARPVVVAPRPASAAVAAPAEAPAEAVIPTIVETVQEIRTEDAPTTASAEDASSHAPAKSEVG